MSMKVVINGDFGGFGLSDEGWKMLGELKGRDFSDFNSKCEFIDWRNGNRHDSDLVKVVETLGEKSWGMCSDLMVVKCKGNRYRIDEYDGSEDLISDDYDDWVNLK